MNQNAIDRAVAKASGETVETIARRGFVLLTPTPREREPSGPRYDDLLKRFATSPRSRTQDFDEIASSP